MDAHPEVSPARFLASSKRRFQKCAPARESSCWQSWHTRALGARVRTRSGFPSHRRGHCVARRLTSAARSPASLVRVDLATRRARLRGRTRGREAGVRTMSTMRPTSVPAGVVGRFAVLLAACMLSSRGAFAQSGYGISEDFEEPPSVRTRVTTRARRPSRSPRARPGASSLLACLSPTHLFGSPADRLTRPCPPAHAPDLVAVPPQGKHERRHGRDRVRLRVQALARGEGTSRTPRAFKSNRAATVGRPRLDHPDAD